MHPQDLEKHEHQKLTIPEKELLQKNTATAEELQYFIAISKKNIIPWKKLSIEFESKVSIQKFPGSFVFFLSQ